MCVRFSWITGKSGKTCDRKCFILLVYVALTRFMFAFWCSAFKHNGSRFTLLSISVSNSSITR
jgi:hypothetical protein